MNVPTKPPPLNLSFGIQFPFQTSPSVGIFNCQSGGSLTVCHSSGSLAPFGSVSLPIPFFPKISANEPLAPTLANFLPLSHGSLVPPTSPSIPAPTGPAPISALPMRPPSQVPGVRSLFLGFGSKLTLAPAPAPSPARKEKWP